MSVSKVTLLLTALTGICMMTASVSWADDERAEMMYDSLKTYRSVSRDIAEVRDLIANFSAAWNRHDILAYMQGLWNSPDFLAVSDGELWRGWSTLLETYQRGFRDLNTMGKIQDDRVQIQLLDHDNAIVLTWSTFTSAVGKQVSALTTMQLRRLPEGWRVVVSHSTFLA